ncbi:C-X-C motif chemokine 3-like [Hippoglossus hippoglossus]|uniref:C-X-C motif chemokine 3-like n=1 Tax=Hippoglossus hippoglossus TaxID=8267 RepID=UPI00148B4BD8|nr:C-X-C motif chemokine 3-like [Hippoglossus hippoglossus]
MQLYLQSVCQLAFLGLCCVLITVRESDGTFVPGRCVCQETRSRIGGPLKELTVSPKSSTCNMVTVIVTKSNNELVCLNPEAPLGKQLIRCWNRSHKLGRDVKLCLKRRRGRGRGRKRLRSRQRSQGHNARASSSSS